MAKTQTIDVNALSKDITIKSSSKNNVLYLKGLTQAELAGKLTGDNSHNDLTITLTSGHKIILKDYFAKNGKFPIKTLKIDTASYNLVNYVNSINIKGSAQNKDAGVAKKLNGSVFDDIIESGTVTQTINALGGNDVINAGSNNATLIGGTGTNTFNYEYDNWDDTSFGKDTIKLTKGETLNLNITYDNDHDNTTPLEPVPVDDELTLHFKKGTGKNANDLIITNEINDKDSITIKNYYGKATGATVLINGKDLSKETLDFLSFDKTRITSSNLKTSALADVIDASLVEQQYKTVKKKGKKVSVPTSLNINSGAGNDTITGSDYADKINAGDGNDTIIGGLGNDTITGGKGNDTFKFSQAQGSIDTIVDATYGDKILISDETKYNLRYAKNGKNLEIFYSDKYNVNNKIVVKNYFKTKASKRIALLEDKNGDEVNLSTVAISAITGKGKFKGTSANDLIIGSNSKDTIKAGRGDDTIRGGLGNDKLYGEKGNNTFVFTAGDGNDTFYSGKGDDTLEFGYVSIGRLDFVRGKKKNKNDLIIKYTDKDSVTIKNFYKLNKKKQQTTSLKQITVKEGTFDVSSLIFNSTDFITGDNFLIGTYSDDVVEDTSGYIFTRGGNDTITAGTEETIINGGIGDDLLKRAENSDNNITYQFSSYGDGHDTIVDNFHGYSYVDFTDITQDSVVNFSNSLYYEEKGNDLIIHYGNNNTVTVKDYINSSVDQKAKFYYTSDNLSPIKTYVDQSGVVVNAYSDNGEVLSGSLLFETTVNGGAGDDTITGGAKFTTIFAGKGDDVLIRKDGSTEDIMYCFNIEGDGNDVIYDTLTNDSLSRRLWFYGPEKSVLSESYLKNTISYKMSGNDLVLTYGTKVKSSVTIKDFVHSFVGTAEAIQWRFRTGGGWLALHQMESTIYTNVTNQTTLNLDVINRKYILAGSGNNTVNTKADFEAMVYGGAGTNTINSYGNDTIVVDREGNDTINLYGANTEKSVWVEKGSKAIINNVMDLTPSNSSSVPLIINFADQDFSKNDVMLYHDYYANELHFVTRNYGLDITLTGIYDGTFNKDNTEGSNYIYEEGNNAFAKFNIIDGNGNLANIRGLINYYDMSKHDNVFYKEFEAIYYEQHGSLDWLIDSLDSGANDSYTTTYIPCSGAKINIYDKGGTDELIFESNPFINDNNNSTFFDVIITRNGDNSLASSSFGDDLYFSGDMSTLFNSNVSDDTYLCIHNYFDGNNQGIGYIESITDEADNEINFTKLTTLKNEIASWIATNTAFSSVSDVITKGSAEEKSDLMAYFTNATTY